ncbi:MAG: repeat protein [Thermoleophilia bacterium]|nr:repeat protein [Thermoleophilia bacterium]
MIDRRCARAAVVTLVCALACSWAAAPGGAATSSVVVDATIPTVTDVTATGCLPGVAGRTDFGVVIPGSSAVTTSDCRLVLGTNAPSSQLLVTQSDGLLAPMFQPARGPLDALFDPGGAEGAGKARTDINGGADQVRYVEIQPADGKIVAGGTSSTDFSVARYMPDGSLDATFSPGGTDGNGRLRVPGPGGENAYGMGLQSDGKILLSGMYSGATDDAIVMRVTTGGVLDNTFGVGGADGDGIVTLTHAGSNEQAYAIRQMRDGRIAVAGLGWTTPSDMFLAVLDQDGNLDPTFSPGGADGNGVQTVDFAAGTDFAYTMDIAADGDFLLAGSTGSDIAVARLDSTGAYDPLFAPGGADGDGRLTFAVAGSQAARSIREFSNGDIVVTGFDDLASNDEGKVIRISSTGVLVPTFATGGADGDGVQTVDFTGGDDWLRAVREQADGKIVATGISNTGTGDDYAMVRLLADGSFDPTFGNAGAGGIGRARVDLGFAESGYGLAIADDGSLVMGGSSGGDYGVARMSSDTISNYAGTWAAGSNTFGACLVDVSAGTAQWNEMGVGNCSTSTAAAWNPIPADTTGGIADVVTFSGAQSGVTVDLRFGMRTATSQAPGAYIAPITFTFVSP